MGEKVVSLETAFEIFLVYYIVFTSVMVMLIESRLQQVENELETVLVEFLKLKKEQKLQGEQK